MKSHCLIFTLAGLAILLVSCTSNEPFRRNLPDPNHVGTNLNCNCTDSGLKTTNCATIEQTDKYTLGYVEFDDQGWFWSHNQWGAVKSSIEQTAAESTNGLVIIVFVHGWKNNAADDNGNVVMFRNVLSMMGSGKEAGPKKIYGVYMGWRGLSLDLPWVDNFSFWNRKSAAERIGHQGAATQVFLELEAMQQRFNGSKNMNTNSRTDLIIIGHSFGGQVVYSAISQILMERLVEAAGQTNRPPIRSFGDLVVLLNPAVEASLYYNLLGFATSEQIVYPLNQRPVLAMFTSKTDIATHYAFPFGRFFPAVTQATRSHDAHEINRFNLPKKMSANQWDAIRQTVGHDDEFINYDLNYATIPNKSNAVPDKVRAVAEATAFELRGLREKIISPTAALKKNRLATNALAMEPYVFTNSINGSDYRCILCPRTNSLYEFKPRNPFLNVSVDKHIMDGHNDITNAVLLKFLHDFIYFTRTNAPN